MRAVLNTAGILVVAGILVSGCRYTPPRPAPTPEDMPTDGSFESTWSAVIDYFADRNIPVETLEKASGYIVAAYQWRDETAVLSSADCGRRGRTGFFPDAAKFNVRVKATGNVATIRVTTRYLRNDGLPCESTGAWERQLHSVVARQVAGIPR